MSAAKKQIKGTLPGRFHETGPGGQDAASFSNWYRDRILEQWKGLDVAAIERIAEVLTRAQDNGSQVFVIGNGGSAATASHMATDFSKTAAAAGKPILKCISLTDNVPFITAIGNDLSFDDIFARQMEGMLSPKDVVILVSGSGNSKNLIKAAQYANAAGACTIGLLGFDGGKLARMMSIALLIPSEQYGVIEDMHISVGHILTFYLKQRR
ncbi:MAG: D-sedoheptulose-7-phosphate isomerase [Elusimicrobiota bacterium]